MVDEAARLEASDRLAAKIAEPDHAVHDLARWKQHAMERHVTARLHHAAKLVDEVAEVLEELRVRLAIAHVARAVRVRVKRRERRREDRIADGLGRNALQHFDTIALVQ